MKIDRVHFYVEDAKTSRDWFVRQLGFQAVASGSCHHTCTEVVASGPVYFVLSSALTPTSPVAQFLRHHPAGVANIAFLVQDVEAVVARAKAYGAKILQPIQQYQQGKVYCRWVKIAAWGSLSHTLLECSEDFLLFPALADLGLAEIDTALHNDLAGVVGSSNITTDYQKELGTVWSIPQLLPRGEQERGVTTPHTFTGIDHVVLNVAAGDLERAVAWYENILEFQSQQTFKIQTDRSALHSQVMVSRDRSVQFPINEPASPNSQIQEFLDANQGAGIQHIALKTSNIVQAVAQFRFCGLSLLPVPPSYYTQLQQRQALPLSPDELQEIAAQQILVDWENTTAIPAQGVAPLLLQTFSQPIFGQPTFFFELIERRSQARGFGEGNFRALFEAIEREQFKRGSLQ